MHKMHSYIKLSICSLIFFILVSSCLGGERQVKPLRCNQNECYKCGSACQTECTRLGQSCPNETKACNWGCHCNDGYARDYNGRCVLIKECPNLPRLTCDRPFECHSCGSACQVECKNYGKDCPIINAKCNDLCYCVNGYARDDNKKCIPVWQCPQFNGPKKCKNPNEHYEFGQVCEKHCATLGKPCIYLSTREGCYCNTGYARDDKGICIPIEMCPQRPCKPNDASSSASSSDASKSSESHEIYS